MTDADLSPPERSVPTATAITTFRGTLQRIDGVRPKAMFSAAFQGNIVLWASEEVATTLRPCLYQEMDVVAQVHYTAEFDIGGGNVLEFHVVDKSRDAAAELRSWYDGATKASPTDQTDC